LSVAETAKFTVAPSCPDGAATVRLAGHASTGGSVSLTVTVKEQLAVPATFEAVHETVVVPTGNAYGEVIAVEPILQVTGGVGLPVAIEANAKVRTHWPGSVLVMILAGQAMVGGVFVALALTVMVKVQVLVLPAASVAMQVTGVVPNGKVEPDGGLQLAVTPGQLSVTIGAGKLTGKEFAPTAALATILAGQVIAGGWESLTVTVNAHSLVFPDASVATQFTVVTPFGKVEPDGGVHTTVTPGQLSVAVAVNVTFEAEH